MILTPILTKSRSRGNAINDDIWTQSESQQSQFDVLVNSQKGLFGFWETERDIFVCDGQQGKFDVTGRYFSKNCHQRVADSSVCIRGIENTATQLGSNYSHFALFRSAHFPEV